MRDDHLLRTRLALTTRSTPPAQILHARYDGVQTARPQALRTRVAEPRFCCHVLRRDPFCVWGSPRGHCAGSGGVHPLTERPRNLLQGRERA